MEQAAQTKHKAVQTAAIPIDTKLQKKAQSSGFRTGAIFAPVGGIGFVGMLLPGLNSERVENPQMGAILPIARRQAC